MGEINNSLKAPKMYEKLERLMIITLQNNNVKTIFKNKYHPNITILIHP